MALMAAIIGFAHLIRDFDNKTLTRLMATLTDKPYTSRQATYDLRRLRRKQIIQQLPSSNRYQLTEKGRRIAVLFTKSLRPGPGPRPGRL